MGGVAQSRPGELGECESANWKCTALKGGEGRGTSSRRKSRRDNVEFTKLKLNKEQRRCLL